MRQRERVLEERAIRITIAVNLLLGVLGLGFALYIHSDAILLDVIFSLISFATSLLSLLVARLIYRPGDDRFPFGYAAFEPMPNLAKGLMIAVVLLFAVIAAIDALATGGRDVSPGGGLLYAVLATLGCATPALITHRMARQARSPIVEVDSKNWIIDALLSAAVAIAFGIAVLLQRSQFAGSCRMPILSSSLSWSCLPLYCRSGSSHTIGNSSSAWLPARRCRQPFMLWRRIYWPTFHARNFTCARPESPDSYTFNSISSWRPRRPIPLTS